MPQLGSRKTRRGCLQCKQRRVKCDEAVPCGACSRRKEECSHLAPAPDPTIPSNAEEWAMDLELMHHYATAVCDIIGVREDLVNLWRDYIPQSAVKHTFLMHGLMALAALHLAHVRPHSSSSLLQRCDRHQAFALERFRSILSSPIDPERVDALFALSATLSVSSMAKSCARADSATFDINTVTELFMLTRGVKDMIHLSYERIMAGPLATLLQIRRPTDPTEASLPSAVSAQFAAVRHMLETYGMDPNALQHCQTALLELQRTYQNIAYILRTGNVELGDLSRWQVMVSMGYITLVQAHNPPALIILAHYVAAMTAVRTAWYTQDWSEHTLRGIDQVLDRTMQHWVHWPMEQAQDRMRTLGPLSAE